MSENKSTRYLLPDGALEVNALSGIFYTTSRLIPRVVSAQQAALGAFLEFAEKNATFPSARFAHKDFEDLESDAEQDLEELFSQVPFAMKAFMDRYLTFEFWTGDHPALSDFLRPRFSESSYRKACVEKVLKPLVAYTASQASSLGMSACIASRKVHDLNNEETGAVKAIVNASKEGHIRSDFCKKCDAAFRNCMRQAVSLAEKGLAEHVSGLLQRSLVDAIGPVHGGLDICGYQEAVRKEFQEPVSRAQLKEAMSWLPFEPIVIRRALEAYGDKAAIISSVATKFGVDAKKEKSEILDAIFDTAGKSCEKDLLSAREKFTYQMAVLEVREDARATGQLQKLDRRIANLDKTFRTVAGIVFPTRLEAALTRNDVKLVSGVLGDDASRCVRLLTRSNSFFKSLGGLFLFGRMANVAGQIAPLLEKIAAQKVRSPFLRLVERALLRCRDYSLYAGNERLEDEAAAKEARNAKRTRLLELFRSTAHPRSSFRLSRSAYLKLKTTGIVALFRKQQQTPLETYVLDRFLGDSFPQDVQSLYDLLEWQLGCDFFERTDESFVEISPDGLPPSYVSTTLPRSDNDPLLLADEDLDERIIGRRTLRAYDGAGEHGEETPTSSGQTREEGKASD